MHELPATLIDAYRVALYRVFDADACVRLVIDEPSSALAALLRRRGVSSAALVTACNPFGECLDARANAALQHELLSRLRDDGFAWLPARGDDPLGDYPGEDSVLILGCDRAAAVRLGRAYRQNAIVWIGADAVPRLLVLRDA